MDINAVSICALLVGRPEVEDYIGLLLKLSIEFVVSRTAIKQRHTQQFVLASRGNPHIKGARIWLTYIDTPASIPQWADQVAHALVCQMGLSQSNAIVRWHRWNKSAMSLIVLLLYRLYNHLGLRLQLSLLPK
ncbi:hypothetical protein SAMN02787148_109107 [Burkholderia vietnamiensis]|nr:hypothetical protein EC918_107154 [Burkholderia vietnamiensis]SCZ32205.1 hypothetical protein SAMN02787148_109107 [Burkholderia vietnamiensis]SFX87565.1 hypothetical protein SAMN02787160_109108 [Burkholderia vietnamiensis]